MQRRWRFLVAASCGLIVASVAGAQEERPSAFAAADSATVAIEVANQPAYYETAWSNGRIELTPFAECSERVSSRSRPATRLRS